MNFNENEVLKDEKIVYFFMENYPKEIRDILKSSNQYNYHDVEIDVLEIFNEFPQFTSVFFSNPLRFYLIFKKSFIDAQQQHLDLVENDDPEMEENQMSTNFDTVKEMIHIKLNNIPYCPEIYKFSISDIDERDIDKFVIVNSTVIRVGSVSKQIEKTKFYACTACGCQYQCFADPQDYNKIQTPPICRSVVLKKKNPNFFTQIVQKMKQKQFNNNNNNDTNDVKNKGPVEKNEMCRNKKFEAVEKSKILVDYQEIKVQEPFKTLKPGFIPKTLWVIMEGNLVDNCKPGDDVVITGILVKRWKNLSLSRRPEIALCLLANSIHIKNQEKRIMSERLIKTKIALTFEEEVEIYWESHKGNFNKELKVRNEIIKSVCPQIYEKNDIKLGLLLCIIGGVSKVTRTTKIRGQSHMILIGEPGTGKSQFLKFACSISTRAVFTNGIGSTSAGLTVSYTKEAGEWMIEPGALVLADFGICSIDEFNLLKKEDLEKIYEAMEQQTISSAKAGLTTSLNARTTIIAACNPVTPGQKYRPDDDIMTNTGLKSPLLSRFDMIFILVDQVNPEVDTENCNFILEKFYRDENDENNKASEESSSFWSIDHLKEYIRYVQNKFDPDLDEQAEILIQNYYSHLRASEMHGKTTIRALESLVRLSQAHARLMFKDKVELFDAVCIVVLMECATFTGLLDNFEFSDLIIMDRMKYQDIEEMVVSKLGGRK